MPVCVCSVWIAQSIPVVQLPLLLKWGLHVRGGGSRQGPWGDGGWKARESRGWGWVHSCHTELLCQMMAACEGVPLIRLAGRLRLGWGQACMWVRMHRGEGIRVSISVAFLSVHTGTVAHMQIYKHSGISQKSILPFRQTAALCRDHHWKPPSHTPIFPFFLICLSRSPLVPHFTPVNTLPLSLFQATPLPPPIPHYPVLTKPA